MLNFCTENQRTCLEPGFNCSTPGFPPWQSGVLLLKTKNWTPDPRYWGEKNGKGSHSQQELRKTQSQATDIHREFLFLMGSSCISQVNKNPWESMDTSRLWVRWEIPLRDSLDHGSGLVWAPFPPSGVSHLRLGPAFPEICPPSVEIIYRFKMCNWFQLRQKYFS